MVKPGKNFILKLTDIGDVERDLTAYVVGSPKVSLKGHGLVDVTAMNDLGHTWASDELEDGSFVIDFLWDATVDVSPWAVLEGLRDATVAKAFEIGPQGGAAATNTKITGTCWLEDLPVESPIGDMVKLTGVPFKINGAVSVGNYP